MFFNQTISLSKCRIQIFRRGMCDFLNTLQTILPLDIRPGNKTALVVITNGCEEMETIVVTDILRRCGVRVTVAGLMGYELVRCSRRCYIKPDTSLESARQVQKLFHCIYYSGATEGIRSMGTSDLFGKILREHVKGGSVIATSGSGMLVLAAHDSFKNKRVAAPSYLKPYLSKKFKTVDSNLVFDDPLLTSRTGPAIYDLAFTLVERIAGVASAEAVAKHIYYNYKSILQRKPIKEVKKIKW